VTNKKRKWKVEKKQLLIRNKMKKITLLFIAIAFAFGFAPKEKCVVDYTGIYVYKLDAESSAVLRFYEDGIVIASTSVNSYKKVMTWFNKENVDMVLSGKYKIKGCSVKFQVKGMTGEQSYKGLINGQSINFELKDVASKATTQRLYTLVKL